ncbi:MAG: 4Fe-4S binding protein, partial [Pseudomonadota bacterium]|nr:4Fe-4S binding protein [Pseudomonadota bacterium]
MHDVVLKSLCAHRLESAGTQPFFLILSMATLGTVFCGICPHSFVGKYLNRIGPKKPLPAWLK